MIQLQVFGEDDYEQLIAEIPDDRFLLQWAGPRYVYPLDAAQLDATLAGSRGEKPSFCVFKAVDVKRSETVGHVQLMNIDYAAAACTLGRVMIFQPYRGKGLGTAMVRAALKVAFEELKMADVILGVFDFNKSAIKIYRRIGFREFEFKKGARQFRDEYWNVIRMKLSNADWNRS